MVELSDGSTIAQLSRPDMRLPIGYALAWPDRITTPFGAIDWTVCGRWSSASRPRPRLSLPGPGLRRGPGRRWTPAVLNAANEVAVEAFLAGRIAGRHPARPQCGPVTA